MINKIFKNIHNKYSKFFKFFFFLRYVFGIFLIAIIVFFSIPKFFDYEKRQEIIKKYLINYYGIELKDYSSIEFKVTPSPNLSIKDVKFEIKDKLISLNTKQFNIFLNFKNIYDYSNFEARKILLNENNVTLDIDDISNIYNYLRKIKYKTDIQGLDLNLKRKSDLILEIKRINFSNYGHKKNKITGEIFDKKFEAFIKKDKNLNFKILNTGINANFTFDKIENLNSTSGSSKISILNNYLKLNFKTLNDQIEIKDSNLKNKNLSINFDSLIKFNPYFEINSKIYINKLDKKLVDNINIEKIIRNHEILKKFNSKNKINYKKKRPGNNFVHNYISEFDLSHGRLIFFNKIFILGGEIECKGDTLLVEEYPRLNFDCFFDIKDKNKIFRKLLISKKSDQNSINFKIVGSLNLLNNKINLETINIDKKSISKEEDINFFKETFERILFDENFIKIFKTKKIKKFILEIV